MAPSGDLIWQLVRKNHAYIKKQKNIPVFSSESGNLTGLNQYKFSGLANPKSVDVVVAKTGEKKQTVFLTQLKQKTKCNAAKVNKTGVKKCAKKGSVQIAQILSKAGYRRDLVDLAQQKYKAQLRSFKAPKVVKASKRAAATAEEEVN